MPSLEQEPEPLVSIGLPVFNGQDFVEQAIRSIQKQTYQNFELIISDNCSTDRTLEICRDLAASDPRLRVVTAETNIGAAGNFNRVAQLATGRLFAWANHDDLWADTYIEKCVTALSAAPNAVLAYSKSAKIDEDGEEIHELNSNLGLSASRPAARLKAYHDAFIDVDRRRAWGKEPIEGFWIPVYGVMHTELLHQTSLIGNYISSDTVLLEELLILGTFVEVEEKLFFKRDHQKRSMRDSEAYDARAEWFTGARAGRLLFPRWRALRARLRASIVLPKGVGSKAACFWRSLSFYVRRRSEGNGLIKEVIVNMSRLLLGTDRARRLLRKW